MDIVFRKIQGPYGRSRRYLISLPREYAEHVLRRGYKGIAVVVINTIALLIPSKGYDMDSINEKVRGNYLYLEDIERALHGNEPLISRLEKLVARLEKSVSTLHVVMEEPRLEPELRVPEEATLPKSESNIPSYLRNNPWLEILSRRGAGNPP